MELRLSMHQQQRLQLTQGIRQSIDILQMSSLELGEYVQEQTADNPLIDWIIGEPRFKPGSRKSRTAEYDSDWWLNVHTGTEKSLEEALIDQLKYLDLDKQTYAYCLILIRRLKRAGIFGRYVGSAGRAYGRAASGAAAGAAHYPRHGPAGRGRNEPGGMPPPAA
ncbi:hypothetical protein LJK88_47510 [Paenibacillus sp. P26]|nr:hypothetical protein LJK88_47510 [Paenibacillus sp. P26]